jgi:signal transduction histidine kinase
MTIRHPRQVLALLCAALILAAFCAPLQARAAETQPQTVRVGYYYDSDYFYKDDNGRYNGYNVEYYYEISKYANWDYQYIDYASFDDAYAALQRGEIDILPSLFYTQERADTLLLSSYDMGSVYVTVVVAPGNDSIAYNDPGALTGKKVGILAGAVDGEKYRQWDAEKDVGSQIITMSSTEELLKALDDGTLDAVAISYLGSSSSYRIVEEFSPMAMYFGMPKDHTALMDQLNDAMRKITIETPDFASTLYSRYYLANQQQAPVFTADEKSYMAASGRLTVAFPENNAPFSYIGDNGRLTGAAVDYFDRISELSGLRFTYVGMATVEDTIAAVKEGKADIVGSMVYDAAEATSDHILLTNTYMNQALTQVTLRSTDKVATLAVPAYLQAIYQAGSSGDEGVEIKIYDTAADCIEAVQNGVADGAIMNTYTANYFINNSRAGSFNITILNGKTYRVAAGLSAAADKTLYTILNRCIRYSNTTTMNELLIRHSQIDSSSIQSIINRIPPAGLGLFAVIMIFAVICLVLFIAVQKRRQQEKDALAAQEAAVAERESQLAFVQKTNEEKNQFFANISHDMRTPLNAILGFAALGNEAEATEEERKAYLEKIQSSGELLLDLINDTLTLSKANSSKLELDLEAVEPRKLIEAIVVPIREAAAKKHITFVVDTAEAADRKVLLDPLKIQKIFLNLLSNAVKYTPEGGRVVMRMTNDPPDGEDPDSILIVSDDGIGISDEFLPHIFEPFAQEKQHGYESVGTGLGLSIVKQLIDLMGGSISVQSAQGKGTTFTVRLHFQKAEEDAAPEKPAEPVDISSLAGKKILVCEDIALNQEITCALLRDKGMTAVTADNGAEGVRIFEESAPGTFAAILMDIRMPVMDGFEATRAIRALDRPDAAAVPIIAMTADAFADDVQRCLDAGMDDHVAKPVDPGVLYAALARKRG